MASNWKLVRKVHAFNVVQARAERIAASVCSFVGREGRVCNIG
jgi:hypothetical protein